MRPWSKIQKLKNMLDGGSHSETAVTIVERDDESVRVQPMNLQKSGTLSAMAIGLQVLHGLGEPKENLKRVAKEGVRRAS